MRIQWFPGHMTKALRMMQDNLKGIDIIGYVLDARAPLSCLNPQFEKLTLNKPIVFILNKKDMADESKTEQWRRYLLSTGRSVVVMSSVNSSERKTIVNAFTLAGKPMVDKYKAKGVNKTIRVMIIGVPNSGKSTLINCIATRKSTVTGDKPGVTKGKQWVRLDNGFELLDTPGTLWSKFEDDTVAQHLAYIGSIKDDIVDIFEVGLLFLGEIVKLYPNCLLERYGLDSVEGEPLEILKKICRRRGFILSGNELDVERGARAVLDDFRKGKLGRITLDNAESVK